MQRYSDKILQTTENNWHFLCQGPEGTDEPGCPCQTPQGLPHPAHSPGPHVNLRGCQSLPQQHHSRAGPQLPATLPCPDLGLPEPGPQPVLAFSCLCPQGSPQCQGLGQPLVPQLSCFWLGWWDRPGLPYGEHYGDPQGTLASSLRC